MLPYLLAALLAVIALVYGHTTLVLLVGLGLLLLKYREERQRKEATEGGSHAVGTSVSNHGESGRAGRSERVHCEASMIAEGLPLANVAAGANSQGFFHAFVGRSGSIRCSFSRSCASAKLVTPAQRRATI